MRGGFSLIEVLVAAIILMIMLLGLLPLYVVNIRLNESVQKKQIGEKILEDKASQIRGFKVENLTKSFLESIGYTETQPSGYLHVSENCPLGYDYRLFQGYEVTKTFGNMVRKYKYTLKLCVDDDYLKPYLKRAYLVVYWLDGKRKKHLSVEVFVGEK